MSTGTSSDPTSITRIAVDGRLLEERAERPESITVTYQCVCGAQDSPQFRDGEPYPPVINCWKCGAGRGMEQSRMIMDHVGMFPVEEKLKRELERIKQGLHRAVAAGIQQPKRPA